MKTEFKHVATVNKEDVDEIAERHRMLLVALEARAITHFQEYLDHRGHVVFKWWVRAQG